MPLPETIPAPATELEVCQLSQRWIIHPRLAYLLAKMATEVPFALQIISGFRTREHQLELAAQGRPAADPQLSTHCTCPAIGADLRIMGLDPGPYEKALFGAAATRVGLRWGGGSPPDPKTGIPSDWNHVDLGRVGDIQPDV